MYQKKWIISYLEPHEFKLFFFINFTVCSLNYANSNLQTNRFKGKGAAQLQINKLSECWISNSKSIQPKQKSRLQGCCRSLDLFKSGVTTDFHLFTRWIKTSRAADIKLPPRFAWRQPTTAQQQIGSLHQPVFHWGYVTWKLSHILGLWAKLVCFLTPV